MTLTCIAILVGWTLIETQALPLTNRGDGQINVPKTNSFFVYVSVQGLENKTCQFRNNNLLFILQDKKGLVRIYLQAHLEQRCHLAKYFMEIS